MLGRYDSSAFTTDGGIAIAAGAAIEVRRESDGALASLFEDRAGTIAITQPGFVADDEGAFFFHAVGISQGYQVKVTAGAEVRTLNNQSVGLAKEFDIDEFWRSVLATATRLAARFALRAFGLDGTEDRATNTILGAANKGGRFVATGSFTQTFDAAATLGADWHVHFRVIAGQTVTLDPNAAELIDGAATKVVVGPAAGYIVCDGVGFHTFGFDQPAPATQTEQEAGTDVVHAVTPGRQHFHPSAAKFWCKFDGTAAGPITPDVDFNVVDVTDAGSGRYVVNIETDFSGPDWSPFVSANSVNSFLRTTVEPTAGTIDVDITNSADTLLDSTYIGVGGFGDQS